MTSSMTGSRGPTGLPTNQTSTGSVGFKNKAPKGYQATQLQKFTPEAMDLYRQMFSQVSPDSYLARLAGGDQELLSQTEEPALRQFSQLQGGLASRFSGIGGLGARKSSGFQNTANQYAADFAKDLQANRQGLQRQAIMDLAGLRHSLLGEDPYERQLTKKEPKQGFNWGGLAGGAVGGIGGLFMGNPVGGAMLGYNAGSALSGQGGGSGGMGGGNYGSFGSFRNPFSSSNSGLGAGYDQEFRMNPAAMGF